MIPTVTITVPKAIKTARVMPDALGDQLGTARAAAANSARQAKSMETAAECLKAAAVKLNALCDSAIRAHNQEIAKLAVEIARKVLAQETEAHHYKIEEIIRLALESVPTTTADIIVRLNPDDQAQCRSALQKSTETLPNLKIIADARLGRAECIVETEKGTVESFIEQNLSKIGQALAGAYA